MRRVSLSLPHYNSGSKGKGFCPGPPLTTCICHFLGFSLFVGKLQQLTSRGKWDKTVNMVLPLPSSARCRVEKAGLGTGARQAPGWLSKKLRAMAGCTQTPRGGAAGKVGRLGDQTVESFHLMTSVFLINYKAKSPLKAGKMGWWFQERRRRESWGASEQES